MEEEDFDYQWNRSIVADVRRQTGTVLVVLFIIGSLSNVLILTSPIYMMQVFNRVLPSSSVSTLVFLTLIACFAFLTMTLLDTARSRILGRIGSWIENKLFRHVLVESLNMRRAGRPVSNQPVRDLAHVRRYLSSPHILTVIDAPLAPVFLLVLFGLNFWMGVVGLTSMIILFLIGFINERSSRRPSKSASTNAIDMMGEIDSALRHYHTLVGLAIFPNLSQRWFSSSQRAAEDHAKVADRISLQLSFAKFVRMSAQILVMAAGANFIMIGELNPGAMIAGSLLLGRVLAPVEQSISGWSAFIGAREAWARVIAITPTAPPKTDPMDTGLDLDTQQGFFVAEDIWLSKPGANEPIITAFNMRASAGEVIGLTGGMASGKSAITTMLSGAGKASHGLVSVDGVNLEHLTTKQHREAIGYLPQDVPLFSGTVFENIAGFDPDFDMERCVEIAKMLGIHDFITHLPEGYQTQLTEHAPEVSAGARQIIGVARAVAHAPDILILDEPQQHLSETHRNLLIKLVREYKELNKTIIIADPAPSFLVVIDTLIHIQKGAIKLAGPKNKVIDRLALERKKKHGKR